MISAQASRSQGQLVMIRLIRASLASPVMVLKTGHAQMYLDEHIRNQTIKMFTWM